MPDSEVEHAFERLIDNGLRSGDTFRYRLAVVWDEKGREYHGYPTNIPLERLSAEEVAQLYSLRWGIELTTFEELKSSYALDKFRTTKIEALIRSAMVSWVANRRLHNLVRSRQPPELRPWYLPIRWG